jgi:hypothetical protein
MSWLLRSWPDCCERSLVPPETGTVLDLRGDTSGGLRGERLRRRRRGSHEAVFARHDGTGLISCRGPGRDLESPVDARGRVVWGRSQSADCSAQRLVAAPRTPATIDRFESSLETRTDVLLSLTDVR